MVRDSLTVVGLLAWMFYLDWKLSLITLVIGPVIALVILAGVLLAASRRYRNGAKAAGSAR